MPLPPINTAQDLTSYAALLSAGAALIAVVVGPIITLWSSKRQLRGTVLSTNRQKWIDELRIEIAGAITNVNMISARYFAGAKTSDGHRELLYDLSLHINKIQLLTNPKEKDHEQLNNLLHIQLRTLSNEPANTEEVGEVSREIVRLSQTILKREWSRVKTLK